MAVSYEKTWIVKQILFQEILEELDKHFTLLQIRYMPIKGAYLIATGIAGRMKNRLMSDIDILIEEKNMHRTADYFSSLQNVSLMKKYTENYRQTETIMLYDAGSFKVCVEIHCALNIPERFFLPVTALFSHATQSKRYRYTPCSADALLICICHMQSHVPFEFRDTSFEEIDCIASQDDFSWEFFRERSRSTGIEAFIYFILILYSRKYYKSIHIQGNYWYARILASFFSLTLYDKMPIFLRRITLDIPFVRKPFHLLLHKITYRKRHGRE